MWIWSVLSSDGLGFAWVRFWARLGLSSFGFAFHFIRIRMGMGSSGRWFGSLVQLRLVFVGVSWVSSRLGFGLVGLGTVIQLGSSRG